MNHHHYEWCRILSIEVRFNFGPSLREHSPSERVFTVWGNLADFIIAVKVMISVRSSLLQPVQSPFMRRIRCFWRKIKKGLNLTFVFIQHFICGWYMNHLLITACGLFLSPVIPHMPHLGSPSVATRIQSVLCMLQQPTAADFSVLKRESKNDLLAGRNIACNIERIWPNGSSIPLSITIKRKWKDTYFDHILWWCSVRRVPRTMSRKAHTVCHGEGCLTHCKWQAKYFTKYEFTTKHLNREDS